MSGGSLQLHEYPGERVRLSCEKCGRAGQYPKTNLIERYGANSTAGFTLGDFAVQPSRIDARRLHGSVCRFGV